MDDYLDLLSDILSYGRRKKNRTGVDSLSLHGQQLRLSLSDGFPLLTSRKINFRVVAAETCWFLSGGNNISQLHQHDVKIWDSWADQETGDLGRIYGVQWRDWRTPDGRSIDQIAESERLLKTAPDSRRNIVTAWNPGELDQMALPPCHNFYQLLVSDDEEVSELDLIVNLRSL